MGNIYLLIGFEIFFVISDKIGPNKNIDKNNLQLKLSCIQVENNISDLQSYLLNSV